MAEMTKRRCVIIRTDVLLIVMDGKVINNGCNC